MSAVGSDQRRGPRGIALALATGLIGFEIALAVSLGAIGVPGLFLIHFQLEIGGHHAPPQGSVVASNAPAASESLAANRVIPIAKQISPKPAAGSALPKSDLASSKPLPPAASSGGSERTASANSSAASSNKSPKPGPVGWKGPNAPPEQTASAATAKSATSALSGPIDLDVKGAVDDLDLAKVKEKAEDKADAKKAGKEQTASARTEPVISGKHEVLPWDEIKPDPTLTGPISEVLSKKPAIGNRPVAQ